MEFAIISQHPGNRVISIDNRTKMRFWLVFLKIGCSLCTS